MSRKRSKGPTEVFVSHSSRDSTFATKVVKALADHGIKAFYSKRSIKGAQEWHDEIGEALKRCDWFVIVLSPNAVTSLWVKRELLFALQQRRYKAHIVPLLYRACDEVSLSWTLSEAQHVDFTHGFQRGCTDLLAIWDIAMAKARRAARARK